MRYLFIIAIIAILYVFSCFIEVSYYNNVSIQLLWCAALHLQNPSGCRKVSEAIINTWKKMQTTTKENMFKSEQETQLVDKTVRKCTWNINAKLCDDKTGQCSCEL